ncbi:MAG TPA: DUF4381 family protein [Lysobacter sp.]|nr:DUF4381 family protein [Lysobacter sp.]
MSALLLRDIHLPAAPPWWPPAPGWWVLAAAVLALAVLALLWWRRRGGRRRAWTALFERTLAEATTPAERVARISELLRRAARQRDPAADRLHGEAWRAFLDRGAETPAFQGELGDLLLHGPFQRDVDAQQVARLEHAARARFLEWGAR